MQDIELTTPLAEAEEECVEIRIYLTTEWRLNFEEIGIKVIPGRAAEDPRKMPEDDPRDLSADRFSPGIDASDIMRQIQRRGFTAFRIWVEDYPNFAMLVIECWKQGLNEMSSIVWSYVQRFLDTSFQQAFVRIVRGKEIITLGRRDDRTSHPELQLLFEIKRGWKFQPRKTMNGVQACA